LTAEYAKEQADKAQERKIEGEKAKRHIAEGAKKEPK